jgi:hypothetical protein
MAVKRSTSSGSTWHIQHTSASVSIANVSIRQHTSAYVMAVKRSTSSGSTWHIQHTSASGERGPGRVQESENASISQHTSAYASIYVSIRQHTSARRIRAHLIAAAREIQVEFMSQNTSAYVSIRQHTSAYISIRQHTSAYVSIRQHT